jgi:stage III sporulation protein AE
MPVFAQQPQMNYGNNEIEQQWSQLQQSYADYLPTRAGATKSSNWWAATFGKLADYFLHICIEQARQLSLLFGLLLLSVFLETIHSTFQQRTVQTIAQNLLYMMVVVLLIASVKDVLEYASDAIKNMVSFMEAMIPIYLTVMAAMGNIVTVTLLHPILVFFVELISHLIAYVVFPLLFLAVLLHLVSALSNRYSLTQMANLFRRVGVGLLGVTLSVFLGVASVQGASGAASDGIAMKATKYVVTQVVPGVGRSFSEATDTALGTSLLVKNTLGLSGLILIVLYCVFPALKLIAIAFMYSLCAALLQPLGQHPILGHMQTISKNIMVIMACVLAIGFIFFFALAILIAAGNLSYMYR